MKAVSSTGTPEHKSRRKVSKPMMEKRRRERINSSLETLRLLMLENTENEKLKNPKVEKAEILESVVDFLKKEKDHRAVRKAFPEEQRPAASPHRSYHDGMRSCLLRVSQFIASKSLELEEGNALQASLKLLGSPTAVSSPIPVPVPLCASPVVAPGDVPAVLSPQRHDLQESETRQMLSFASSATVPDPVWRPWPK
ncbi:PREDICTED: transcription factor HES-7.1-like isoform X1 [Poecilia mexicana]|uniref:BHLH domain-containing protein n=2 Tax=Poecilia mexicana TaxID=48701 RepID=A0A3B3WY60_9TELE|nr:PREDICTED: transcription factor HES-7.1-like isoform X1 [Poecilia mexicana]